MKLHHESVPLTNEQKEAFVSEFFIQVARALKLRWSKLHFSLSWLAWRMSRYSIPVHPTLTGNVKEHREYFAREPKP